MVLLRMGKPTKDHLPRTPLFGGLDWTGCVEHGVGQQFETRLMDGPTEGTEKER
jgi:hypothetical protein